MITEIQNKSIPTTATCSEPTSGLLRTTWHVKSKQIAKKTSATRRRLLLEPGMISTTIKKCVA
jgi:hypothetical protein